MQGEKKERPEYANKSGACQINHPPIQVEMDLFRAVEEGMERSNSAIMARREREVYFVVSKTR